MSDEKHTPPPWHVSKHTDSRAALIYGADDFEIARACYPNRDANAHLIAASPRLYEALLKCQAVIMASQYRPGPGEPPVLRDGVVDEALQMARTALAAARGERE